MRLALGERRNSSVTDRTYRNLSAVAASILLVAIAGTLFVTLVYSPLTVTVGGSTVLGFLVRFLKLTGTAILGAFVGALVVLPAHSALTRRDVSLVVRAILIGLLSFALFIPLAIIEAIVTGNPPAYWLILALPASAFGFFGTLLYALTVTMPAAAKILASCATAIAVVAALLWIFVPEA
jgi:hypothetical protein